MAAGPITTAELAASLGIPRQGMLSRLSALRRAAAVLFDRVRFVWYLPGQDPATATTDIRSRCHPPLSPVTSKILDRLRQGPVRRPVLARAFPGVARRTAQHRVTQLLDAGQVEVDPEGWVHLPDGPFPAAPSPRAEGPDPRWWTPSDDGRTWSTDLLGFRSTLSLGEDSRTWRARIALGEAREEVLDHDYPSSFDAAEAVVERLIEIDGLRAVLSHPGRERDEDGGGGIPRFKAAGVALAEDGEGP